MTYRVDEGWICVICAYPETASHRPASYRPASHCPADRGLPERKGRG